MNFLLRTTTHYSRSLQIPTITSATSSSEIASSLSDDSFLQDVNVVAEITAK